MSPLLIFIADFRDIPSLTYLVMEYLMNHPKYSVIYDGSLLISGKKNKKSIFLNFRYCSKRHDTLHIRSSKKTPEGKEGGGGR